ncbi:MAG: hypothetical protein K2X55_04070 [Burkholderiaceae bacterium]|nr:hypothetical protein [Burkholderiaceae bacterium]
MGFVDRYVHSLNSNNLQDDELHHSTDALCAAALADVTGAGLGALLARVKYADGSISKEFEGGTANLAQLLRAWHQAVVWKGRERRWVREGTAWDAQAAQALYKRVAERSLAHWLDGKCKPCGGTGKYERLVCKCCKGNGAAAIECGGFERERVLDMVAELENLLISHNARAAGRMRRQG